MKLLSQTSASGPGLFSDLFSWPRLTVPSHCPWPIHSSPFIPPSHCIGRPISLLSIIRPEKSFTGTQELGKTKHYADSIWFFFFTFNIVPDISYFIWNSFHCSKVTTHVWYSIHIPRGVYSTPQCFLIVVVEDWIYVLESISLKLLHIISKINTHWYSWRSDTGKKKSTDNFQIWFKADLNVVLVEVLTFFSCSRWTDLLHCLPYLHHICDGAAWMHLHCKCNSIWL